MPIATNPDTGEVLYLDNSGKWSAAKTAVNPQTREMMAFDGKGWQAVTTHGHGILSYIDDAVRAAASGMTFGFADKIAAKMDEVTGLGGTYAQNLAAERAKDERASPAVRIPAELAGMVATGAAAAPVTGALSAASGIAKLPLAARMALGGAGAGAAFGASGSDNGLADDAMQAGAGAVIGAATGGALAGAGRVASHIINPGARADAEIGRAIQRDSGLSTAALGGKEPISTLADQGGENVKGLMERVAQTPGAGRTDLSKFLTDRQNAQLARISGDLRELTGTQRTALQATEQQIAARTKAAAPVYQAAFDAGDKPIWSNEIERLSAVPEVQSAMKAAVSGWQRTQIANGYGAMNPGTMVDKISGGILKFLNGRVPVFPNLQFWDYTKNALDDMISSEIKLDGTMTKRGRDLSIIVQKLRGELDKSVPQYQAAREAWSGPTAYINAINMGKGINRMSAEEVSASIARMSEPEREAFRIGAISDLLRKAGNKGGKLADITSDFRSPEMRGKISAIMPTQQAAAKWAQRLEFETKSSELVGRSLKGSQTARRMLESQDANSIVGDLVMDAFKGKPPISLFGKILSGTAGKMRDTIRARTDAEIAKKLMAPTIGRPAALFPQ